LANKNLGQSKNQTIGLNNYTFKSMKTVLTVLFAFFFHFSVLSQNTIYKVVNKNTGEGIPFVNIYSTNGKVGLYSDESGEFTINAINSDTIVFSHVGFKNIKIPIEKLPPTIVLDEDKELLNQVKVVGTREVLGINTDMVGFFDEKHTGIFSSINQAITYFPNEHPNENAAITRAYFKIGRARIGALYSDEKLKNRRITIRLKVYRWDPFSKKPGAPIPIKEYVQTIRKRQLKVIFDLMESPIPIPREGICIGLEYLGYYSKEGKYIVANINDKNFRQFTPRFVKTYNTKSISFIKSEVGSGEWGDLQALKANFQFSVEIKY